MTLTEITDGNALIELREAWRALVERAENATIYQTWEWNEAWWRTFRRGKTLRLLLVRNGEDLVGIAPFYVSRHLGTPLRRLAFLGTGCSDYLDIIAARDAEAGVFAAVRDHLDRASGFDLADLQQLPQGSRFAEYLRLAGYANDGASGNGAHAAVRILVKPMERCPYVRLPDTWEEFRRGLSKSMRQNIGYYERLVRRELPDVAFEIRGGTDIPEAMAALFRLHQRRWRAQMLPGVLGSPAVRRFHLDVANRFQDRGWLRLHVIRSNDTIIAALYCFRYRNRYYYYLGGFEPKLARYSLGTTLTSAAIRQAIEEGCVEFDFLRGEEAYKERWRPEQRTNLQCLIPGPSAWRSEAMFALNRIERYIEHRAKAFSDRGKGVRT